MPSIISVCWLMDIICFLFRHEKSDGYKMGRFSKELLLVLVAMEKQGC